MPIRDKIARHAVTVIQRLQEAGYEAHVVGGAVRDLLLDRAPTDYDLATNATPEEIKEVFRRQARIIGRRFRLVHVYMPGSVLEVSTFRRQPSMEERKSRESDSGLMVWRDNVFGTLEEDAYRRDFSVNAIYFDPVTNDGELTDHVGGVKDMEQRIVRAIGDPAVRLAEDPVRMLRACKLAGQYGFSLEPELAQAISLGADQIQQSSPARLMEELFKLLKKPFLLPTLRSCHESGLLCFLLPDLDAAWDAPAGKECQRLLEVRDRLIAEHGIYHSRMTGLATLVLPFVIDELESDAEGLLWDNFTGIESFLSQRIRDFFSGYQIPRYSVAKTRDILLLLPKMLAGHSRRRVMQHPEYNRARDTFMTYLEAASLGRQLLEPWPEAERQRPRRRPRQRRRRRSRPKE